MSSHGATKEEATRRPGPVRQDQQAAVEALGSVRRGGSGELRRSNLQGNGGSSVHSGGSRPSFELDGLLYELEPPRKRGRTVATVRLDPNDAGFTDRVDLYAFKSRETFAKRVADAFGRQLGDIMGHLAVLLDGFERAQEPKPLAEELTSERVGVAQRLLERPDLLDLVAQAMPVVGEAKTKRLAYLVATSRLMQRPLSALLLAPSGTGKSALLDAVTLLIPPEHVESLARLTPQSLYYMGRDALRHKLIVVDEYEGTSEADHPLRVLQSRGELRLSVTGKEALVVRGPIAVMSGTTATNLDIQNTSRCLELALDDSPEQTRRIQAAQARAWSGKNPRPLDPEPWRDAQRILKPMSVVIPYAEELGFPARTTTDRRSSAKLLGLVAAHALLYQRQRERLRGSVVATHLDYQVVQGLLQPVIDGITPRAARAYRLLLEHGEPVDRRFVAEREGWAYNTAKKALAELVEQELVAVTRRGPPALYRVLA